MKIIIAEEFSDTPGGRMIAEGDFSGELFREDLLLPRYKKALEKHEKLEIDFNGAFGYPPSFLDEAFGGMVKILHERNVLDNIIIISNDDLTIERKIKKYVTDAEKEIFGGKWQMKKDKIKYIIIGIFSIATIILLIINAIQVKNGFWNVEISDGIEIFILIFVSYFLVDHQNIVDRKKAKINDVISKVQVKILDPNLIDVDTENNKKATRIKLTTISNLLEIVKKDISEEKNIESIISEMDSLSAIVMDHLDDI